MTQTVPATAALGPGKTGLTIGLRVLNLDGTTYAAFSTTGVAETSTAGTYRKAGGVVAPLAGGYIVWGTAGTDYAEATVDSAAVNVTLWKGATAPDAPPTAAAVADAVWDAARSGHAGAGTFGATDEWAGSVDEAAIAAAVLAALEGSPITAICINPERSEESDYDNLRRTSRRLLLMIWCSVCSFSPSRAAMTGCASCWKRKRRRSGA
jgi:hypothetical protein